MKIRFYGKLADVLGKEVEFAMTDRCTVADLRRALSLTYPAAAGALANERVRACVGDSIVTDGHLVSPTDELDFLAPVSGG